MDEVIIEPRMAIEGGGGGSMMQLDILPSNDDKDSNLPLEDDDIDYHNYNNEVKGELDLVPSEGEASTNLLEPYEGMEFESEEAARVSYSAYARHFGFRIRISRYTRSRRDNSIISRLLVCSKEGFRESRGNGSVFGERKQQRQRAVTRVGCKAMLMVKRLASGRWVVSKFVKEHNHGPVPPRKLEVRAVRKEVDRMEEPNLASYGAGDTVNEPFEGMEFDSEEDARTFYINYARQMGFRARISKYCRSRKDNSIISRQIVCSKEGFREVQIKKEETDDGRVKRPRMVTRIGCKAMVVVKKLNTGKWAVARFEKEHNHALVTLEKAPQLFQSSNDCTEKGLAAPVGGDDMLPNAAMVMSSDDGMQGASQESLTGLYNQLCYEAIKYAQEGAVSEEIYNVAMSALKEAAEKVAAAKRSAATVGQGINGGHGSNIANCSNKAKKPVSGNELVFMQQPLKFVLIPSTSLANDSKPANHSVESPMMLHISNGQGISIHNSISVLKQSPTAQSVKGLAENGVTERMCAGQNSQKLDNLGESQAKTTPENGNKLIAGISDTQMVAFPALPVTLYMPVMGSLSESFSGTAASSAYTLVAGPVEASPVITGTHPQVNNNSNVQQSATPVTDRSPQTYTGPNPQVHATAIAAGARVIPPQEAASVIKAIEARVRSSKSAPGSGCKQFNSVRGLKAFNPTSDHADALERQEHASPEEVRLHEPMEGFKEMDAAMMEQSAVYDSACEDHLFSDGGS